MGMFMKKSTIASHPCLEVSGRIINRESAKFKKKLDMICDNAKWSKVVVDFSHTDFIDSFGLGALVRNYTVMQKDARELVILNTNPDHQAYVHRLFDMTGLINILKVVDSKSAV